MSLAKQPTSQLFSNDALTAMKEAGGCATAGSGATERLGSRLNPPRFLGPPPSRAPRTSGRAHGTPPDSPAPNPPASGPGTDPRRRPASHQLTKRLQCPHAGRTSPVLAFRFRLLPGGLPGARGSQAKLAASLTPPFRRTLWLLVVGFGSAHPRLWISPSALGFSRCWVFLGGIINQTRGWADECSKERNQCCLAGDALMRDVFTE